VVAERPATERPALITVATDRGGGWAGGQSCLVRWSELFGQVVRTATRPISFSGESVEFFAFCRVIGRRLYRRARGVKHP
jgi:hypothetical protein